MAKLTMPLQCMTSNWRLQIAQIEI